MRKELKRKAKQSLKKHYLRFVMVCLIAAYLGSEFSTSLGAIQKNDPIESESHTSINIIGGFSSIKLENLINESLKEDENLKQENLNQHQGEEKENAILGRRRGVFAAILNYITSGSIVVTIVTAINSMTHSSNATFIIVIIVALLLMELFYFLFVDTYTVIARRVFMEGVTYEKIQAQKFLFLIRVKRWLKASWVIFVKNLYHALWSLTILGGLIKEYSYMMVPFIVAENPDVTAKEAIGLSRRMMKGHKWECFVLKLSFIGWDLLGFVTLGIGHILFKNPYYLATMTQYYIRMRVLAKEQGIEGAELLNDRYLFEKPEQGQLSHVYMDVIKEINAPQEKMDSLKGIHKWLANWFGILLVRSDKEVEYEKSQMRQIRIAGLKEAVEGNVYPNRLFSIQGGDKEKRMEMIYYMRHYTIWSLILIFFIVSFIGWMWEVSLHLISYGVFINRGILHGPWLPIYGFGGILILIILNKFRKNPVLEFVLIVVLCGVLEYFTAYYLEVTKGLRWWDYSGYFINLHGRICAEGLLVFGIGGIAIVYFIAPLLDNQIRKLKTSILIPICILLLIGFAADQVYSNKHPNTGEGITNTVEREISPDHLLINLHI